MDQPLKNVKEVLLIEKIARAFKVRDRSVIVPIGDDAAVVRADGNKCLLYTVDMQIEGVHFKKGEDYQKVGYKALAVSVSDIAAMGGIPKHALVSVGLPREGVEAAVRGLFSGIKRCARKFGVDIIGGDTNRSRVLVVDIFLAGEVECDKVVLRSGARAGDHIFVSGPLGGSLKGRHLMFEPRVKESRFLVENFKVTSMIDLSDGLAIDLNRIASASQAGALLFEEKIPKNKGVVRINSALYDGEDFELLFTMAAPDAFRLLSGVRKKKARFPFYSIGKMTSLFSGVKMWGKDRRLRGIACDGFRHF